VEEGREVERRHHSPLFYAFVANALLCPGNEVGDLGATSLAEALKFNTALTWLDLNCK